MDFTILKTLRKDKGLKLKDLAPGLGISSGYLSMIERNLKNPSVQLIEDICEKLNCKLMILWTKQHCWTVN